MADFLLYAIIYHNLGIVGIHDPVQIPTPTPSWQDRICAVTSHSHSKLYKKENRPSTYLCDY